MRFFDFFTEDIAIDLGTANTLIIHNDKVIVDEPSIVATELRSGKVIAVGSKAQQMHGKAHKGIETTRPLKDGVIADFDAAESMIREFIKKIPALKRPELVIFNSGMMIPSELTFHKSISEWVLQLETAPHILDRIAAINVLKEKKDVG